MHAKWPCSWKLVVERQDYVRAMARPACIAVKASLAYREPNTSTIYRWTTKGLWGVRLESIFVGNTRCTSREALQRFAEALTAIANSRAPRPVRRPGKQAQQRGDGPAVAIESGL